MAHTAECHASPRACRWSGSLAKLHLQLHTCCHWIIKPRGKARVLCTGRAHCANVHASSLSRCTSWPSSSRDHAAQRPGAHVHSYAAMKQASHLTTRCLLGHPLDRWLMACTLHCRATNASRRFDASVWLVLQCVCCDLYSCVKCCCRAAHRSVKFIEALAAGSSLQVGCLCRLTRTFALACQAIA